jgi:magnesium chelatase subunit D
LCAEDLRVKHFRSKAGALFLFAVDASGSMALHRMRQAKGAVHALLQQAYVHRDRVALLAFRGTDAALLLPPSQSVELARRALDLLPTGGGTPIASALLQSIEVAKQARGRGIFQTVLVLLTDGRANVGLRPLSRPGQNATRPDIQAELQHLGRQVALSGIQAIVVDTQRSYLSRGEARTLAEWLDGTYIYLPNANGTQIAEQATAAIEARREQRHAAARVYREKKQRPRFGAEVLDTQILGAQLD